MEVQHGYCRTGAHPSLKSPAVATPPCPRHPPFPRAHRGAERVPRALPFPAGSEFSCSLFCSYKEPAPCWAGRRCGCPADSAGGAARPEVPARSAAPPGAGPRSVAPPGRSSGPGRVEQGRTTGGGAPQPRRWAVQLKLWLGTEPLAAPCATAAAMELLRVLLAAALLPLLPREYPRERARRRKSRVTSSRDGKAELCRAGSSTGVGCVREAH